MLHKYYMIALEDSSEVDSAIRDAVSYNVQVLYKIGIYGQEKQHELFLSGSWLNCHRYMLYWKRKHNISSNSTKE